MSVNHHELRYHIYWHLLGWLYLSVIVYLSLMSDPPSVSNWQYIDKIEHFAAYGVLMGWFAQLHIGFRRQTMLAILFCVLGVVIEFVQGWSGHRFFDIADMLANSVGVLFGWWVSRHWASGLLLWADRVFVDVFSRST